MKKQDHVLVQDVYKVKPLYEFLLHIRCWQLRQNIYTGNIFLLTTSLEDIIP